MTHHDAHSDTPAALEAFREEVRTFIRGALPEELRARVERGYSLLTRADHTYWQKQLYARGWAAPNWPIEYGGTGWSAARQQVFDDECGRASCPRTQPGGIKLVGPIIFTYGTPEQKQRFLDPILRADEWWCQGYSEPNAGSDLAALQTRAVREGEFYRVNGQKVWTTLAHWADWMFCLVRTDNTGKRQEGITFLLIDMKTPGITIRPFKTLDLAHHTNEVFFEDVLVPVANRIGDEGKGWTYAKALLAHERAGIAELGRTRERLERLKRIAREPVLNGAWLADNQAFRTEVARLEVEILAAEATTVRLLDGRAARPALASVLKLRGSEITQRLSQLNMLALGPHALQLDLEAAERGPLRDDPLPSYATGRTVEYLRMRSLTVAGGTSEIQRNLIARLALNGGVPPSAHEGEDAQLAETVQRFARDHQGIDAWRAAGREHGGLRPAVWQAMAEMGWLAVNVPEDHDGLGMGAQSTAIIMHGVGAALLHEPYWSTAVLGARLVATLGTAAQRKAWLPAIAKGEMRLAVALMEPGTRHDWTAVQCKALRAGNSSDANASWIIDGRKIAVLDGANAQHILLLARDALQRPQLFCIPADTPGIQRRAAIALDERPCDDYVFNGVRVAEACRLSGAETARKGAGQEQNAVFQTPLYALVRGVFEHAFVALGAEAVGAMDAALEQTIAHLNTRKQFGKTLAEFQALQHRVADMVMAIEQTRSLVQRAAVALDAQLPDAGQLALAVKIQAGLAGRFVGENAVQLHGGIGVTDELHVGHYLKRLWCIDLMLGDAGWHLNRYAASVL